MPEKLDLHIVQEISGNLRIDDGDEGSMLELSFHDTWARDFSDHEKLDVLEAVVRELQKIFDKKNMPKIDQLCDRRGAVAATRAKNVG